VLLPDLRGLEEATTIAQRIRRALSLKLRIGTATVALGASIGLAAWPAVPLPAGQDERGRRSPPTPDALLHDADTAMYLAKSQGVGYQVFAGTGDPHADRR
jgi:GGDEF domain-containing protein